MWMDSKKGIGRGIGMLFNNSSGKIAEPAN